MSRAEVATNHLRSTTDALTQAHSRIVDVDVAEESAALIRNQVLQQAAQSILAQANQQPQLVLKLLRNS